MINIAQKNLWISWNGLLNQMNSLSLSQIKNLDQSKKSWEVFMVLDIVKSYLINKQNKNPEIFRVNYNN